MKLFTADADYVPRMEECARLCCEEHGEAVLGGKLDWPYYRAWWIGLVDSGSGLLLGYELDGETVAGFGGALFNDPVINQRRATQVFMYAKPCVRGKISIRALLRRYEAWARENGCVTAFLPCLPSMACNTPLVYNALGYRFHQGNYVKTLVNL